MTNIDFLKSHLEVENIADKANKAFLDNAKYDELCCLVINNLLTKVWDKNCWPINDAVEDVLFDYEDLFFAWWLEDEYDGWFKKEKIIIPTDKRLELKQWLLDLRTSELMGVLCKNGYIPPNPVVLASWRSLWEFLESCKEEIV